VLIDILGRDQPELTELAPLALWWICIRR
jgi:hypothetical protein